MSDLRYKILLLYADGSVGQDGSKSSGGDMILSHNGRTFLPLCVVHGHHLFAEATSDQVSDYTRKAEASGSVFVTATEPEMERQ